MIPCLRHVRGWHAKMGGMLRCPENGSSGLRQRDVTRHPRPPMPVSGCVPGGTAVGAQPCYAPSLFRLATANLSPTSRSAPRSVGS